MPHLQTLVERHKDDEFVLIGINAMDSPEAFRKGVKDFGVSWLSAYQGQESSPISDLYAVKGYPTYVLIDAEGKIREKGHSAEALDASIPKLLEDIKSGALK